MKRILFGAWRLAAGLIDLATWQPADGKFLADTDTMTRIFEVRTTGQYFRVHEVQ
jgi:hypothetical protein